MTTRYAVLLDSLRGSCGGGNFCATFSDETFAKCKALAGRTHDGETEEPPFAAGEWHIVETWPFSMVDMLGNPDPGVIARLESR